MRICLDKDCDVLTRFNRCTQSSHYQTISGHKEYPAQSLAELKASIRRLERLGWPGLEQVIARRQAKIEALKARQNGDN